MRFIYIYIYTRYIHVYADTLAQVVIRVSKELEYVLETHFLSTGKGLHEKITNADDLPEGLVRKMRFLATIRCVFASVYLDLRV